MGWEGGNEGGSSEEGSGNYIYFFLISSLHFNCNAQVDLYIYTNPMVALVPFCDPLHVRLSLFT